MNLDGWSGVKIPPLKWDPKFLELPGPPPSIGGGFLLVTADEARGRLAALEAQLTDEDRLLEARAIEACAEYHERAREALKLASEIHHRLLPWGSPLNLWVHAWRILEHNIGDRTHAMVRADLVTPIIERTESK
jgi:hypothetical protein